MWDGAAPACGMSHPRLSRVCMPTHAGNSGGSQMRIMLSPSSGSDDSDDSDDDEGDVRPSEMDVPGAQPGMAAVLDLIEAIGTESGW